MTEENKLALNNSTQCPILDARGVSIAEIGVRIPLADVDITDYDVVKYCLECPLPKCILKSKDDDLIERARVVIEKYVQCLTCGSKETLTFRDGVLEPTQKWYQVGEEIRHRGTDCGIAEEIRGTI